jgi:hypothetical protein
LLIIGYLPCNGGFGLARRSSQITTIFKIFFSFPCNFLKFQHFKQIISEKFRNSKNQINYHHHQTWKKNPPFPKKKEKKEKKKKRPQRKKNLNWKMMKRWGQSVWWMNETLIIQELLIFCWYSVVCWRREEKKKTKYRS